MMKLAQLRFIQVALVLGIVAPQLSHAELSYDIGSSLNSARQEQLKGYGEKSKSPEEVALEKLLVEAKSKQKWDEVVSLKKQIEELNKLENKLAEIPVKRLNQQLGDLKKQREQVESATTRASSAALPMVQQAVNAPGVHQSCQLNQALVPKVTDGDKKLSEMQGALVKLGKDTEKATEEEFNKKNAEFIALAGKLFTDKNSSEEEKQAQKAREELAKANPKLSSVLAAALDKEAKKAKDDRTAVFKRLFLEKIPQAFKDTFKANQNDAEVKRIVRKTVDDVANEFAPLFMMTVQSLQKTAKVCEDEKQVAKRKMLQVIEATKSGDSTKEFKNKNRPQEWLNSVNKIQCNANNDVGQVNMQYVDLTSKLDSVKNAPTGADAMIQLFNVVNSSMQAYGAVLGNTEIPQHCTKAQALAQEMNTDPGVQAVLNEGGSNNGQLTRGNRGSGLRGGGAPGTAGGPGGRRGTHGAGAGNPA